MENRKNLDLSISLFNFWFQQEVSIGFNVVKLLPANWSLLRVDWVFGWNMLQIEVFGKEWKIELKRLNKKAGD